MNNVTEVVVEKSASLWMHWLGWIVTIIVPVVLVLTAVRIVLNPWVLHFEYNSPGFPADRYGFTKEERLYWSKIAVEYLLNPEGISFLGDLRFADGAPVFNERELVHMVDVKNTVRKVILVWYLALGILLGFGFWAWKGGWWSVYRHGLGRGGWLTVFLIVGLLLFILLSFSVLFVTFHNVFFAPGTWTFNWNDTLIRLFPQRFWRDLFLIVGGLSLASGLMLGFGFRKR